jgi:hypothetical protein
MTTDNNSTGISYIQQTEGRLTGLVTSCVGTAFYNTLPKKRRKKGYK